MGQAKGFCSKMFRQVYLEREIVALLSKAQWVTVKLPFFQYFYMAYLLFISLTEYLGENDYIPYETMHWK